MADDTSTGPDPGKSPKEAGGEKEKTENELRLEKEKLKHQLELEKEKSKHEREIEKEKGKRRFGAGAKAVVALIIIIIIILIAAVLTLQVTVSAPEVGATYPYAMGYGVAFPEGQVIQIGNIRIVALTYQGEIITEVDGISGQMSVGGERTIPARRATIKTLGLIPVTDTDFQVTLKYKGERDNVAYFDLIVKTSRQVPDYIIRRLLPPEISAVPIQVT